MNGSFTVSDSGNEVTLAYGEQTITLPLEDASEFVGVVFGARKAGYAVKREFRQAEIAARKEKSAEKKAQKSVAKAKRNSDRIARLKKALAEAEAAAKTAAKPAAKKAA